MACLHLLCLPFMPQSLLGVMFFVRTGVNVIDAQRWCQARSDRVNALNEMQINYVVNLANKMFKDRNLC